MSFTTRVAAAALALLTFSTPAMADNSFSAHEALVGTISDIGVDVYLNPSQVCDGIINGAYISGQSALVVCQDNATPGGGQAEWTENDLDTLRHEAQHLIQDCIAFRRNDGTLSPMIGTEEDVVEFALSILGEERVSRIAQTYANRGANHRTIILELEAFAVARAIDASTISDAVEVYCAN